MNYPRKSKRTNTTRSVDSIEKFNSWSGDPPRTLGARAPNETPPSGNHHILSPPHHTTSLVNRERCTGDAKLDGWLAHGKLGRLVDGELQVNSIVPLLASASLLPSSEWHLLALTLHSLCLTATLKPGFNFPSLVLLLLDQNSFLSLVLMMLSFSAWPTIWHLCLPAEISVDLFSSHYSKAWQGQH